MCGDTWNQFLEMCMYAPPRWLANLADYWDALIIVIFVLLGWSIIRFCILATQDKPTHLAIGLINNNPDGGDRESSKVSRSLVDYRVHIFLIQFAGSVFAAGAFFHWRNPMNLLGRIETDAVWKLSPLGVDAVLQVLQRLETASIMWILFSTIAVLLLYIDPYGYHKYVLTPLVHDLEIENDRSEKQKWKQGETRTLRESKLFFNSEGLIVRFKKPVNPDTWIILSFSPAIAVTDRAKLEGLTDPASPDRFVKNGTVTRPVMKGSTFYIGTDPNNKLDFS